MDDFQRREKLRLEILENSEEKEHFPSGYRIDLCAFRET